MNIFDVKYFMQYLMLGRLAPSIYKFFARILDDNIFDNILLLLFSKYHIRNTERIKKQENHFFYKCDNRKKILHIILKFEPGITDQILTEAGNIINHIFDLLGSGPTLLEREINWHQDFKSNQHWYPELYANIQFDNLNHHSEIKIPWELSRFQHIGILGQAYWISGHEKYAKEFVNQLDHWIENNPPRIGVNWCNSMEVAIRLVNWIAGYHFFKNSPSFNQTMKRRFYKFLLLHQIHIYHNLEFSARRKGSLTILNGNHFIADLMGLLIPAIVFPHLCSGYIFKTALQLLNHEIQTQINADGVHYELSTSYHRLVLECFICTALLMQKNNQPIPQPILTTIEKMLEFVMAYLKPDGTAPQIRDGDNGRLFSFGLQPIHDHRYLLTIGAVLFNRPDFKAASDTFQYEALWWLGSEGYKKYQQMPKTSLQMYSHVFPNSGFYTMKSQDDYLMFISAGVGMKGRSAHAHNDALSFELLSKGESIIVDPGTYIYTAHLNWRNTFRSTDYHNTIRIDGDEMNRFDQNDCFLIEEEAHPVLEKWASNLNYDFVVASHKGYHKLKGTVFHRRMILYDRVKRNWKIIDHITGSGLHFIEIFFHFSPEFELYQVQNHALTLIQDPVKFKLKMRQDNIHQWKLDIKEGWISPSYGIKEKGSIAVFSITTHLPVKTSFLMQAIYIQKNTQIKKTANLSFASEREQYSQ